METPTLVSLFNSAAAGGVSAGLALSGIAGAALGAYLAVKIGAQFFPPRTGGFGAENLRSNLARLALCIALGGGAGMWAGVKAHDHSNENEKTPVTEAEWAVDPHILNNSSGFSADIPGLWPN